jgi:hypothetical protein
VSSGRFRRASSHAARLDQVTGSAKSQSGPLVSSSGTVAAARYVILAPRSIGCAVCSWLQSTGYRISVRPPPGSRSSVAGRPCLRSTA